MKDSKNKKALFTIDIKISGQIISIPVYESQNHQALVRRFCDQHLVKSQYQQAVKDKIIQSLLITMKKAEISAHLREKVYKFLNQNEQRTQIKPKIQKTPHKSSCASTPFKLLGHCDVQNHSNRGASLGQKNQKSTQIQQQKKRLPEEKPIIKPQCIRKNKRNDVSRQENDGIEQRSLVRSKVQDTDLITAYQTIYKKSKEPAMKQLAKRFLQENGYFKSMKQPFFQNKKIFEDIYIPEPVKSMPNKTLQIEQNSIILQKQKVEKKPNIPIEHFLKQNIVQPFDSEQSPVNCSGNELTSSKKKRIKYNIEQNSSIHEFQEQKPSKEAHRYSRFEREQQRTSYRPQRESLSYQRLPYNHQQERLIYKNYPADFYDERPISLRKTRKYKYL